MGDGVHPCGRRYLVGGSSISAMPTTSPRKEHGIRSYYSSPESRAAVDVIARTTGDSHSRIVRQALADAAARLRQQAA